MDAVQIEVGGHCLALVVLSVVLWVRLTGRFKAMLWPILMLCEPRRMIGRALTFVSQVDDADHDLAFQPSRIFRVADFEGRGAA
jgi:hypothetical protein